MTTSNESTVQISQLATYLRNIVKPNNSSTFSISTTLWSLLSSSLDAFDEEQMSSSFHVKQSNNAKSGITLDLKFLSNFVQQTKALKLYEYDKTIHEHVKDISRFKNVTSLEFYNVDLNTVKGIQKLRSQLQKLICHRTLNLLSDMLSSCGADQSNGYCWNELKALYFTNNEIKSIDNSLEFAPWLQTLDLSHNEIISIEALNCLHNLKQLNLSYNKLEAIPQFKGQICSRLRNLILKNNYIEDISGLQSLTNLVVLDLSNNCLIEHRVFLFLSHLATLQWLNSEDNPLYFHPNHRSRTVSCLHINTLSTQFVLDNEPLSNTEKKLIGTLHPIQPSNSSFVMTDSMNSVSDKIKKVRHVVIEEEASPKANNSPISLSLPQPHLETKKQIENLHEQYGESWLNSQSGVLVQNMLGLESSLPLSSSPYEADFTIHSGDYRNYSSFNNKSQDVTVDKSKEASFETALDITLVSEKTEEQQNASESSDNDLDDDLEGEESIYLATPKGETDQIFVVITKNHLSEKECSTSKEKVRWHLKSIIKCETLNESTEVLLNFDTMRKDKQQRVYVFEDEDVEKFVTNIRNIMAELSSERINDLEFQCMKCSTRFLQLKNESVLSETSIKCPNCDSNLVIESVN